ncbi:MAG TPA: DUF308 domain-containing protein [Vicinamibacterales bacterium]|nr:DUF308 domain-containing protein [Vicinamibacterales bacterium]
MLAALAANWGFVLLRVVIAASFGGVMTWWPNLTMTQLAWLFGAYALTDGVIALIIAIGVKGHEGFGSFLFDAIVRVVVGAVVFAAPAATAYRLVNVFAVWALLCGAASIAVAIALRKDLSGEWPLPLAGLLSILCGVLALSPVGVPDPGWVIGSYVWLFALIVLSLALRLRQLAEEIRAS